MNRHLRVCRTAQLVEAQQQRLREENDSDEGSINDARECTREPETLMIQEALQDGEAKVDVELVTVKQEPTQIEIKQEK